MKRFLSWILFLPLIAIALVTFPVKLAFYSLCYILVLLSNAIIQLADLNVKIELDVSSPIKFKVKV